MKDCKIRTFDEESEIRKTLKWSLWQFETDAVIADVIKRNWWRDFWWW